MTRSNMWPVSVWSNGRYHKYELSGREIASGPSFEIDHDYVCDFVAKPISKVLHRLYEDDWATQGKTPDCRLILTGGQRVVKIGVGLFGGPAQFILDGERCDTPEELLAAL